ncbi:nucleoside-diphosphate kinase [Paenibacillus doosanensis]|uniref:Nucleoside diphosphate kinase n=1 Tax=Paenibacillus konkukensis TaxID=2020716 RepID=A0ABY4RHL6_9BACL|nr:MULTISPECIES: nucleoside-diphosphate kinase [Paenibacillus]MCS7462472.1 nucleoside-diphosphate kinase [Paenibacillus doosanensis]UQZ81921.1 Nucleoside diphosphate kinase [Paenibacillus konkukensis]
MERTFLMVKPDGVQRGLIGEIVKRFEQKGFQLVGAKLIQVTAELAERHYEEHKGKDFYDRLVDFITSGPVFAMVWEGDQVVALSRAMIGKTSALDAAPGTIRSDYAIHTNYNLIHGSDSPESAQREIANFFAEHELLNYSKVISQWI